MLGEHADIGQHANVADYANTGELASIGVYANIRRYANAGSPLGAEGAENKTNNETLASQIVFYRMKMDFSSWTIRLVAIGCITNRNIFL